MAQRWEFGITAECSFGVNEDSVMHGNPLKMLMRPHVDNTSSSDDERADHPIANFCHKLLPREEHYSTVEKECLAIKLAVQAFCFYLLGHPFIIQTDHCSLELLEENIA